MRLNLKQTKALDHLEDDVTEELLYGGSAGGGKSVLGCYWQLKRRLKYPGTRGLIGRAVMKTLKETTLKTLFEVAAMQGLKRGVHYDLTSSQDKENPNCITFYNGSLIFLRDLYLYPSDEDFDELGSLEITDAYIDECSQVVAKAKDILKVRIRYKLNDYNLIPKILFTTNPTKNWAYYDFYQASRKGTLLPHRKFIQAFAWDNPDYPKTSLTSLENMPEGAEKERLFYGNWDYVEGEGMLCDFDAISDMFTNEIKPTGKKYISADLAMGGRDRFVAGVWDGLICYLNKGIDQKKSTGASIESDLKNLMQLHNVGHSQTVIDSDGMGAYLESYLKGIKEFHGGGQPTDKKEFANLKAECAYKLAEMVNKRMIKVVCNAEQKERIMREMGVLRKRDPDADESRKRIMKKDDMKEELQGRSPDYLDMLIMKMIFHVAPTFVVSVA